MAPPSEKNPLDEDFPQQSLRQRLLQSRFFIIAVMVHVLILGIFGGRIIFIREPPATIESASLLAPPPAPPQEKPIDRPEKSESKIDVQAPAPKTPTKAILSTDKLSPDFNVPSSDVTSVLTGTEIGGGGRNGKPGGKGTGEGEGGPVDIDFVKIAQKSVRVIYCVDVSRSMISEGRSFKVVENELTKQLRLLNETNEFNVITFAKVQSAYKDKLVPGNATETGGAAQWFHKLSPENFKAERWKNDKVDQEVDYHLGSHPQFALEKAFEQNPAMIVLLHDGNPTDISRQEVLDKINEYQSKLERKIVVHTIFFDTTSGDQEKTRAKVFMETVATNTGGTFRTVKFEKKSASGGL